MPPPSWPKRGTRVWQMGGGETSAALYWIGTATCGVRKDVLWQPIAATCSPFIHKSVLCVAAKAFTLTWVGCSAKSWPSRAATPPYVSPWRMGIALGTSHTWGWSPGGEGATPRLWTPAIPPNSLLAEAP